MTLKRECSCFFFAEYGRVRQKSCTFAARMKQGLFSSVVMAVGLTVVLLVSSCGSSRRTPVATSPYPYTPSPVRPTPSVVISSTSQPKTPEEVLVLRMDSLLVAEDSLLSVTQLGLHVVDLTTGRVLYGCGEQQRLRPASSEKMMTAIAALDVLGPGYTLDTRLMATAAVSGGVLQGDLYIKGAMDPLLSTADVQELVWQLKARGVKRIKGRLVADASMKDGDDYGWGWCWDDKNPVLSPLLCGGKPGLAVALKNALQRGGVNVGMVTVGVTPATARELVAFRRPLTAVLQPMMKESDNLCAEAVFYQMGRDRKAAAMRIQNILGEGSYTVADGSGLSLYNYQTPEAFTKMLAHAVERPDSIFTPLLEALPIAGVDGTLKSRMKGTAAEIAVRAKTGTVTGVSSLVGYTTQRSRNHLIAFAIMNQGVLRSADGRRFQDEVCRLLSE